MKDLVYIAKIKDKDLVEKFPNMDNEIRFPSVDSEYYDELIKKYFSFNGFYRIKKCDSKEILLEKSKIIQSFEPKDHEIFRLILPNTNDLQNFYNSGISRVKGKMDGVEFEGDLEEIRENNYRISLDE